MASKRALAVFFFLEVAVIIAQWTTLASIPSFPDRGGAASFGSTVFAAVQTSAYTLDSLSGIWTTVASRPVSSSYAAVGALSGQRAIVAGGNPSVAAVHVFDMQAGTWTVKADLPISVEGSAAGCDGQRFWVAAGYAPPTGFCSELQEYDSDADVWTSKTSLPLTSGYVSGAYWDGTFIVSKDAWIHVYAVALDAWTTGASLPSDRANLYGGVAAIAGFAFVVGGSPTPGNTQKLERYDIGNDVWTSLDPVPKLSWGTATAITSAGLLVAVGDVSGPTTYVHGFTTASPAGASGDPLFHTFTGPPVHLSLGTAVFNFLTTPTVVVNALVEEISSLPPEENTLVTTLAVLTDVGGCLFLFYCSVVNEHVCQGKSFCDGPIVEWRHHVTELEFGYLLSVGGLSIQINTIVATIEYVSNGNVAIVNTTYINVWVHPPPAHFVRPAVFGGIIGDLCTLGARRVLGRLVEDAYTVEDGCLFASEVKATAGMFSQLGAAIAVHAC